MIDPLEIRAVGRYAVVRFIAEGGFAWVFEVVDPQRGVHRALKMLKRVDSDADFERFQSEAEQLERLGHPCLVQVFDIARDPATGCPFFTMTLIDGPNLKERLRALEEEGRDLPWSEVVDVFTRVLAGLSQLHARGIVHRDVKPGNILLTREGQAVLSDLGIARTESSTLTRAGMAIGTALYMAPEQAAGRRVSPASDVFSLGLCLYQALEGRVVYDGVSGLDATSGHAIFMYLGSLIHGGEELPFEFTGRTPPALRRVVERACRLDPVRRHPDAAAMLADFREALDQGAPGGSGWRDEGIRWTRAGGLLLALGLAVAGSWWWLGPGRSRTPPGASRTAPSPPPRDAAPAEAPSQAARSGAGVVVALSTPRGSEPRFAPAETLELSVAVSRDAFVYCFYRDGKNRVVRIFPNRWQPDAHVARGEAVRIPDPGAPFQIRFDDPDSHEEVACMASERRLDADLRAELGAGDLAPIPAASLDGLVAEFRRVDGADVGVGRLPITVTSR